MVRAAGASAQVLGSEGKYVLVRLQSGEVRMILGTCRATVGVVGNEQHGLVNLGKAGRNRWKGVRPTVRGSVMNPNDHPHGGGEGKAPVGRKAPSTPWGKPALGLKTRNKKAKSDKLTHSENRPLFIGQSVPKTVQFADPQNPSINQLQIGRASCRERV